MSERDESQVKLSASRRRRRSLRVPLDEVPRRTPRSILEGSEGASTLVEMPVFHEEQRFTLVDVESRPQTLEDSQSDPVVEVETFDGDLDDYWDGEQERSPSFREVGPEASDVMVSASTAAEEVPLGMGPPEDACAERAGFAATASHHKTAPDVDDDAVPLSQDQAGVEAASSERRVSEAAPARSESRSPRPIRRSVGVPSVGVIVQRVVAVVSGPPPPPAAPLEERAAPDDEGNRPTAPEVAVEVDDDEPELRISEPDAAELDELVVEMDEGGQEDSTAADGDGPFRGEKASDDALGAEPRSEPDRSEAPATASEERSLRQADPEQAPEDAEELLEFEEPQAESRKRLSKPPPPPPPPPPGRAKEVPREPSQLPEAETGRRKKLRRNWWEELFNDDYLRTVPIPEAEVIARQCDFIEQRLGLVTGATILDVGCGLGLHAVELTRRGYLVVGLDLSLPMLARAADEAQDSGFKINFLHADMREMNFEGAFDAVLCYGTSFGYFDDEGNKQVVERLHRALKPKGLLLLEVVNRDFVIRSQPNLVWFEGDGCVVMEESQVNYITSRLEVKRNVILDDGRQRDNLYSLRTYSLHELGQILHQKGFRVVEVTGWEAHPGVFFGADSPKLIILAQRRPAGPPVPASGRTNGEVETGTNGEDAAGIERHTERQPAVAAPREAPADELDPAELHDLDAQP